MNLHSQYVHSSGRWFDKIVIENHFTKVFGNSGIYVESNKREFRSLLLFKMQSHVIFFIWQIFLQTVFWCYCMEYLLKKYWNLGLHYIYFHKNRKFDYIIIYLILHFNHSIPTIYTTDKVFILQRYIIFFESAKSTLGVQRRRVGVMAVGHYCYHGGT